MIFKSRFLAEECSDFNSVATSGKPLPWRIHGTAERRCRPASAGGKRPHAKPSFFHENPISGHPIAWKRLLGRRKTFCRLTHKFFEHLLAILGVCKAANGVSGSKSKKKSILLLAAYLQMRPVSSAVWPCHECARALAFLWYQQN